MDMNLAVSRHKKLLKWTLVLFVLAPLLVAFLALAIALNMIFTHGVGPAAASLASLVALLPDLSGRPVADVKALLATTFSALPLAFTSVCFDKRYQQRHLNIFGIAFVLALVISAVFSMMAYLLLKPYEWGTSNIAGMQALMNAQEYARLILATTISYLTAILGVKVAE